MSRQEFKLLRFEYLRWRSENTAPAIIAIALTERKAFRDLLAEEINKKKQRIRNLGLDPHDVSQEVMLLILKAIGEGKCRYNDEGSFEGFWRIIFKRRILDVLTKYTPRSINTVSYDPIFHDKHESPPGPTNLMQSRLLDLPEAINQLPEELRTIIQMRLSKKTNLEIAQELGLNPKTVVRRIADAKSILGANLQDTIP